MSINDLVTRYIAFRRSLGERCNANETTLRSFCRAIGPRTSVARIPVKAVAAFLAGPGPVTSAWHRRYSSLKGFFRFAVSRGHLVKIPLPTELPKQAPPFVPYIYSRDDLRNLLDALPLYRRCNATPSYRRVPARIEPHTLRAILLLLYGAGLRGSEALRLSGADVDLSNSLLTIRDTKFFKSRLVPIGRDLTKVLGDYARARTAMHPSAEVGSRFFLDRHGAAIRLGRLQDDFKRLREHAGVRRCQGARYQPRLHDLRHTFAVNRLTEWYRHGADVQRLVYQLSVYLGHTSLAETQVYLTMTTALLQQASMRFERYARRRDSDA